MSPDGSASFPTGRPYDLSLSLSRLPFTRKDGTWLDADDGVWRTTTTPEGPATLKYWQRPDAVGLDAWGPGSHWALDRAPRLLGVEDDPPPLGTTDPRVAEWQHRFRGYRLAATLRVFDRLVPTALGQLVSGAEAKRSWMRLSKALATPAPGPKELFLPPSPASVRDLPEWRWMEMGIRPKVGRALREAADHARRLEAAAELPLDQGAALLQRIPGIGPWTALKTLGAVLGHPDAVPPFDFNLPHTVTLAFTGAPRGDDETMFRLLEPFRGNRRRVVLWILAAGIRAPRFGPRREMRSP